MPEDFPTWQVAEVIEVSVDDGIFRVKVWNHEPPHLLVSAVIGWCLLESFPVAVYRNGEQLHHRTDGQPIGWNDKP
jgi:hypothetical protein